MKTTSWMQPLSGLLGRLSQGESDVTLPPGGSSAARGGHDSTLAIGLIVRSNPTTKINSFVEGFMQNIEIDIHSVHRFLQKGADDDGQPIVLVDCREQSEYELAKIKDSILMPMGQWPPSPESLEPLVGKRIVVHCHHGGRSLRVANWFRQNGHPEATSMSGGIDLWSQNIDATISRY